MLAQTDAARAKDCARETGPAGDSGARTIGTYEVTGVECLAVSADEDGLWRGFELLNGVFPVKTHTERDGAIEKKLMEDGAADAAGRPAEGGFGDCAVVAEERDAVERMGFVAVEIVNGVETESGECLEGVRQEAFAASLVDGGFHGVGDVNAEALEGAGDGAGQAGGTCSDDEGVHLCFVSAQVHRDNVLCKFDAKQQSAKEQRQGNDNMMTRR